MRNAELEEGGALGCRSINSQERLLTPHTSEQVSFHSNPDTQRMFKLLHNCTHLTH